MGIKLEIDQEIALRIIDSDIKFIDSYYTKRLAELEKEYEAIKKKDGYGTAANFEAGVYKSMAMSLFESIQKFKEELIKHFNYE
jgi:hypothetical protein